MFQPALQSSLIKTQSASLIVIPRKSVLSLLVSSWTVRSKHKR